MSLINPLQQCLLPDDYVYKVMSCDQKQGSNCTLSFKIKNVKTEVDAQKWVKDYEEKSKFTWRKSRTIPAKGMVNVLRHDYRCQHNVPYQKRTAKLSKNTDCPATMKIVIKRFLDAKGLKKVDEETKMFPCIVDLHSWHNHASDSASVLRFRDMSSETREKLVDYFITGHTAATARRALKTELILENPTDSHKLLADSSLLPSLSKVQHLFNATCRAMYGEEKGDDTATRLSLKENEHDKLSHISNSTTDHESSPLQENEYDNSNASSSDSQNKEILNDDFIITVNDKEDIKNKWEEWCKEFMLKVSYGLEHNSEVYVPAVKNILSNAKKYASTETGLITALHYFGKGPHAQSLRYCRRKGNQIGVQPTAIGRRKRQQSGKRKLSADRPSMTSKIPH